MWWRWFVHAVRSLCTQHHPHHHLHLHDARDNNTPADTRLHHHRLHLHSTPHATRHHQQKGHTKGLTNAGSSALFLSRVPLTSASRHASYPFSHFFWLFSHTCYILALFTLFFFSLMLRSPQLCIGQLPLQALCRVVFINLQPRSVLYLVIWSLFP